MRSRQRAMSLSTASKPEPTTTPGRAPTFLFIGGQRCASTWVHRCLSEHPEVFIPPHELHYFDSHYDRGVEWYLSHFTPEPRHKAWGDKTPAYLTTPEAPRRVHDLVPGAKLVCCLREPVDRAYSLYHLKRLTAGWGTFEEALESDPRILEMGCYAEGLARWFEMFPRDSLLILLYDELAADEAAFARRIYEHIGVDPLFRPSVLGKRVNAVVFPRLRHALRRVGMEPVVRAVGRTWMGGAIRRWNHGRAARAKPMADSTRRRLMEYYREPNRRLEQLLGIDLAAWNAGG